MIINALFISDTPALGGEVMQIVKGRRYFPSRGFSTLIEMIRQSVGLYADRPAFLYHDKPGSPEIRRNYRDLLRMRAASGRQLESIA